ncbi:MAG: hypothetical protein M5U19_17860 [Microthrixaceae bacterium]|nr:hypothetical protein [Microthrixaceae bacterium]
MAVVDRRGFVQGLVATGAAIGLGGTVLGCSSKSSEAAGGSSTVAPSAPGGVAGP